MKETFKSYSYDEWRRKVLFTPMGKMPFTIFKATPLETFLSKTLPYCRLFPLTLRQRVKLRNRLRYAYYRRWNDKITKILMELDTFKWDKTKKYNPEDFGSDFYWELITNRGNGRNA